MWALCLLACLLSPVHGKPAGAPVDSLLPDRPSLDGRLWATPPGADVPDAQAALALYRSGGFSRLSGNLSRGYTTDVIWLAVELPFNAGPPHDMVLEVGPAYLDHITAYQIQADGGLQPLGVSGDQVPQSARALLSLEAAFPLQLPAGRATTVLLRIDTVSTKSALVRLHSSRSYAAAQLVEGLVLGGIFAVSVLMMFLALGTWFLYRQRCFLLWGAYVAVTAGLWLLLDGIGNVLLPDDKLHWANHATSLLSLLSSVVGTLFMRAIFEVRNLSLRLHQWLGACAMVLPGVVLVAQLVGMRLPTQVLKLAILPLFALVGFAIVWQMVRRERVGLVYGPAFLLYLGTTLHNVLATLGWVPFDWLSLYGWQVAGFFNLLSLQVAMLAQVSRARDLLELERQRLTRELAGRNAELEQRVAARTQTLESALREVQNTEAEGRELLSMVSHEFRTPAAVIKASLDSLDLLQDKTPPEVASRLTNLRAASQRMIRLADEVLTHDRLSEAELDLHSAVMDLRVLLQETARPYAQNSQLGWQLPAQPVPVRVDASLISIALTNLADNALRHHPSDAPVPVWVTLSLQPPQSPHCARVEVIDWGPGVPDQAKPRIFERFFVVHRDAPGESVPRPLGAGRDVKSHGLGLAIVRRIALAHGGSVSVRDNDPQGTVFTLNLPLASVADPVPAPPQM